MALSTCARCNSMFNKRDIPICPDCLPQEDADYETVREALQGAPGISAEDVADATGVDLTCILRFLENGRIETTLANKTVICGRCGAHAISLSKRLCESCLQRLNGELSQQKQQIQLPQKKRVELGGSFKGSGDGGVKFQR